MSKQILRGFVRLSGSLRSWLEEAEQQNRLQPGLDFKVIANYIIISLNGAAALYISSRDRTILDQTIRQLRFYINWSRPEGGMFIWAERPEGSDMETLYWKAVEKKVAYVPEKYFYTSGDEGIGTMMLNFTMADEKTLDLAVSRLAQVFEKELNGGQHL
jgi:aspartate/methionine/tyrosine aminotransferase